MFGKHTAPNTPEEIFDALVNDYRGLFKGDLESVILYGSGARGAYVPGRSDLNFLIILKSEGIDHLEDAAELVAKWKKRRVATPLFMTQAYLCASVDVYPIEFLNMKLHHVTVSGPDVLAGLVIAPEDLRLQLEREFKGKIVHLRKGLLEAAGDGKRLQELIRVSLGAFLSAFSALLYMKGREIPPDRASLVVAVEEAYGISGRVFGECLQIREGTWRRAVQDTSCLYKAYLREVLALCSRIDAMKTNDHSMKKE